MVRSVLAATLVLALAGCHDRSSPAPPTHARADAAAAPAIDAGASAALRDPHRFDCATDDDCLTSCEWGAVNKAWYARASALPDFGECEDGCANQLAEAPRCEAGACVAYRSDPHDSTKITRDDRCTRREP